MTKWSIQARFKGKRATLRVFGRDGRLFIVLSEARTYLGLRTTSAFHLHTQSEEAKRLKASGGLAYMSAEEGKPFFGPRSPRRCLVELEPFTGLLFDHGFEGERLAEALRTWALWRAPSCV